MARRSQVKNDDLNSTRHTSIRRAMLWPEQAQIPRDNFSPRKHRIATGNGRPEMIGARKPAWLCGFLNFCYMRKQRWRSKPVVPQGFQRSVLQTLLSCIAVFASLFAPTPIRRTIRMRVPHKRCKIKGCVPRMAANETAQGFPRNRLTERGSAFAKEPHGDAVPGGTAVAVSSQPSRRGMERARMREPV